MRIVVLRDGVTVHRVRAFARERGWTWLDDVTRSHYVLASIQWITQTEVHVAYVEDHTADVRSMQFEGAGDHDVIQDVRTNLPAFDPAELLLDAESSPDPRARIRALNRLAACRPVEVHHRYLAVWARALSDPDRAVRRAAIRTAYGCCWAELAVLVRQRLRQESDLRGPMSDLLAFLEESSAATSSAQG